MTDAIATAIQPATRVVAITWVHSGTGVKTPVRAIADAVAAANAKRTAAERILLCVDGVHGFGVEDATVADLGCDFFAAGTHKWMFGPRGTGVLWGRAELWPIAAPDHSGLRTCGVRGVARRDAAPPPMTARAHEPRRVPLVRASLGARRSVRVSQVDRQGEDRRDASTSSIARSSKVCRR